MRTSGPDESSFTLVELLLFMIVIGIPAIIVVPLFFTKRAKAHDTATKADVCGLGKTVAAYFVDGTGTLTMDFATQLAAS